MTVRDLFFLFFMLLAVIPFLGSGSNVGVKNNKKTGLIAPPPPPMKK